MQYGISKGSCIRYIGASILDFFSYCGWDRPVIVGTEGDLSIQGANTSNFIAFQGLSQASYGTSPSSAGNVEDFNQYMESRKEVTEAGNYVLLKDGSWQPYDYLSQLVDVDRYARTVDGMLRLKEVKIVDHPGFLHADIKVDYKLYDYLPQKPQASISKYSVAPLTHLLKQRRREYANLSEDAFFDVEIGLKQLEGTTMVVVEQTDADYPVPYTYIVDNFSEGKFIALMNHKYPSKFRITYKNKNGSTISDSFTINLATYPVSPTPPVEEGNN